MDVQKVRKVLIEHEKYFRSLGIKRKDFPHNKKPECTEDILSHCYAMIRKIRVFLKEGRIEKAFRWLGFIQGCLWSGGDCTLEELRSFNRSNREPDNDNEL